MVKISFAFPPSPPPRIVRRVPLAGLLRGKETQRMGENNVMEWRRQKETSIAAFNQ